VNSVKTERTKKLLPKRQTRPRQMVDLEAVAVAEAAKPPKDTPNPSLTTSQPPDTATAMPTCKKNSKRWRRISQVI